MLQENILKEAPSLINSHRVLNISQRILCSKWRTFQSLMPYEYPVLGINKNALTAAFRLPCLGIRLRNEEAINSTRNRIYLLKVFYFLLYRVLLRRVFFRIFAFYLFLNWFSTCVSNDHYIVSLSPGRSLFHLPFRQL